LGNEHGVVGISRYRGYSGTAGKNLSVEAEPARAGRAREPYGLRREWSAKTKDRGMERDERSASRVAVARDNVPSAGAVWPARSNCIVNRVAESGDAKVWPMRWRHKQANAAHVCDDC
jgi:hypothetical protein